MGTKRGSVVGTRWVPREGLRERHRTLTGKERAMEGTAMESLRCLSN
jgi:hypothetical protein